MVRSGAAGSPAQLSLSNCNMEGVYRQRPTSPRKARGLRSRNLSVFTGRMHRWEQRRRRRRRRQEGGADVGTTRRAFIPSVIVTWKGFIVNAQRHLERRAG